MTPLTTAQLHILQHTLGLDEYGRGNSRRNHFVADDDNHCQDLVELGLMALAPMPRELTGGCLCYSVTPLGVQTVQDQSPEPPKLSRSKQRYQEFLDADTGVRFGDWTRKAGA